MRQDRGIFSFVRKGVKKYMAAIILLFSVSALYAQERISKQMLVGEWQFEKAVLEEKAGQYSTPTSTTFRELDSLEKTPRYPLFYTVKTLIIMPDGMNINTLDLSLLDAPFDIRYMNGRQILEIEDNRPEDQREQSSLIYEISLSGKQLHLSGKYFYRNATGQSIEGVLTTTLQHL